MTAALSYSSNFDFDSGGLLLSSTDFKVIELDSSMPVMEMEMHYDFDFDGASQYTSTT